MLRQSASLVRDLLYQLNRVIRPGVNELDISTFCENYILIRNAEPFLKVSGLYPSAVLISRNNRAYHSLPENRALVDGDIVTVDVVLRKDGWFGDGAWTYEVGKCSSRAHDLVEFSRKLIAGSVAALEASGDMASLGSYIEASCRKRGYRVLSEGAGHGIGIDLHEEPLVRFCENGESLKLERGMVFTIEPVITDSGSPLSYTDRGAAYVEEGCYASQFEHMIAVGEKGLEILTAPLSLFK